MKQNVAHEFIVPQSKYSSLIKKTYGQSFNKNLVELRSICGLTQVSVANYIGINRETYSNYEKGRCHVPSNIILLLADMYQIPIDLFFGRTKESFIKKFY